MVIFTSLVIVSVRIYLEKLVILYWNTGNSKNCPKKMATEWPPAVSPNWKTLTQTFKVALTIPEKLCHIRQVCIFVISVNGMSENTVFPLYEMCLCITCNLHLLYSCFDLYSIVEHCLMLLSQKQRC